MSKVQPAVTPHRPQTLPTRVMIRLQAPRVEISGILTGLAKLQLKKPPRLV